MRADVAAPLPESVAEIAEVIGRDEALRFIGMLPVSGTRSWRKCVYIPKNLPTDHRLVEILGWTNAHKMSRAFSGMILQPSNCRFLYRQYRNRQIRLMHADGEPVADIADRFELSIYRIRELVAEGQQIREGASHG